MSQGGESRDRKRSERSEGCVRGACWRTMARLATWTLSWLWEHSETRVWRRVCCRAERWLGSVSSAGSRERTRRSTWARLG